MIVLLFVIIHISLCGLLALLGGAYEARYPENSKSPFIRRIRTGTIIFVVVSTATMFSLASGGQPARWVLLTTIAVVIIGRFAGRFIGRATTRRLGSVQSPTPPQGH